MKESLANCHNSNIQPEISLEISYIKCTYDINDINESIQIINNRGIQFINEEIEAKVKILNGDKKEKLIFKKKFDKLGLNTVHFIIEEKLTNMSYMFNQCSRLKEVNFISVETKQVTKMRALFEDCKELEYLDLSNFDTSNVNLMTLMFFRCHKLKEIKGLNNFNTVKVIDMVGMFEDCKELEYLDLSNFNTSNVLDIQCMFLCCHKLKEIKGINKFDTSKVTNMEGMFFNL